MKRTILLALLATTILAQQGKTPTKMDMMWACRLENTSHPCRCPAMVAEERDKIVKDCGDRFGPGSKEYSKCMAEHNPSECEIVQHPDLAHPEHTCTRWCTTPVCRCHDGPPCVGKRLVNEDDGQDDGGDLR